MRMVKDFPDIDVSPNSEAIVFDFGDYLTASGLTLTGTPTVTCAKAESSEVDDPSASSRFIGGAALGIAPRPLGSGVTNGAVVAQFQTNIADVVYVLTATCLTSVGTTAELWGHMTSRQPK